MSTTMTDARTDLALAKAKVAELEREEAERNALEAKAREGRHREWAKMIVSLWPDSRPAIEKAVNDAEAAFGEAVCAGDFGKATAAFAHYHRLATIEIEAYSAYIQACAMLGHKSDPHSGTALTSPVFRAHASFAAAADKAITRHVNTIHADVAHELSEALQAWIAGSGGLKPAIPAAGDN